MPNNGAMDVGMAAESLIEPINMQWACVFYVNFLGDIGSISFPIIAAVNFASQLFLHNFMTLDKVERERVHFSFNSLLALISFYVFY